MFIFDDIDDISLIVFYFVNISLEIITHLDMILIKYDLVTEILDYWKDGREARGLCQLQDF